MSNIHMNDMLNYLTFERDRWMCDSQNMRLRHPRFRRTSQEILDVRIARADRNVEVVDAIIEKLDADYYKKMKPLKEESDRIAARLNALLSEVRERGAEANEGLA